MYGDPHYQERMFQAGAVGYVLKNEAIDELVDAMRAALKGLTFVSPAFVRRGAVTQVRSAALDKQSLSGRERDVLRLLAEGKRTKEIADVLQVSPKTIETYRSRIMVKLGIDTVAGLVKFAIRAGLISPES
jgi:DNA-binding NarL/FixJ family response regulator